MPNYKMTLSGSIIRDDGACTPANPKNIDYLQYVSWCAEGNTAGQPPTPEVPQAVSSFQGRAALMQAGYLDDVEQYMATADPFEQLAWDTVTEMRRTSPLTIKLATLLGLTDGQVDDMFVFAFTISA